MYTFALLLAPPIAAPLLGIAAGSVTFWGEGLVIAAVQPDLDLKPLLQEETTTLAAVLDHDRVNQTLFATRTLLPLRFGTVFASEAVLTQHLAEYQTAYYAQLTRLVGQGEFTLTYMPVPLPPPLVEGQGRDYFTQRKAQFAETQRRQHQQQLAWERMLATLAQQFGAQWRQEGTRLHLLVAQSQWDPLITWVGAHPSDSWQFTLTGPFPPYHFV